MIVGVKSNFCYFLYADSKLDNMNKTGTDQPAGLCVLPRESDSMGCNIG